MNNKISQQTELLIIDLAQTFLKRYQDARAENIEDVLRSARAIWKKLSGPPHAFITSTGLTVKLDTQEEFECLCTYIAAYMEEQKWNGGVDMWQREALIRMFEQSPYEVRLEFAHAFGLSPLGEGPSQPTLSKLVTKWAEKKRVEGTLT